MRPSRGFLFPRCVHCCICLTASKSTGLASGMKTTRRRIPTATFPVPCLQTALPLESTVAIPQTTRQQCLPLIAQMLAEIVRQERKERDYER
jgi:hypothetical protein